MEWLIAISFLAFAAAMIAVVLKISAQVNERLAQMNQSLQEAHQIFGQNLSSATGVFGSVKEQLGRLEQTNTQIMAIGKEISGLQELLRAPKFRGQMGETMLENLLAQVLPREYYQMQRRFKSGEAVDAAIRLGGRLVPVDAKFPLENFQKMLEAEGEEAKGQFRKKFLQDAKNRISEIANKYILPGEDTYDFALMYIPAENVYYEMIVKEDLLGFCAQKKVIPVSPNTFYAYLQVICLGLKGLKIEENAKRILKDLSALGVEISRFGEDFNTLGAHLKNASLKYDDSQKRLVRFSERLLNIQDSEKLEQKTAAE